MSDDPTFDTIDAFRQRLRDDSAFAHEVDGHVITIGTTKCLAEVELEYWRMPPDGEEMPGALRVSLHLIAD